MTMNRSNFTNRPTVESKFIPNNYDLNNLRTSGWYAPIGDLVNGPEKFKLYHLFVIAPNPDVYITQLAFGTTYKIVTPSAEEGDDPIVDDEIIRDRNNNIVYTARRVAADINNDGTPDTDQGDLYVSAGGESYETMRFVTNDNIPLDVHPLSMSEDTEVQALDDEDDNIVEDVDSIVITNRSAIFSRSYFNGTWSYWTIWTGGLNADTSTSTESGGTSNIDVDRIYSYIDGRINFESFVSDISAYGMKVEIIGTYNEAPYDPDADVYGVAASGIEYEGFGDFPSTGDPQKLYIAKSENKLYRYDEQSGDYFVVGSDYNEIFKILSGDAINVLPPENISNNNSDNDENSDG